jgi:hypothetical protein
MANTISVRAAQFVQFNIDTDGAGVGGVVNLVANRQYFVSDITLVNTTAGPISGTMQAIDTATVPNVVTFSTINAVAANTIVRPTLTGAPGAGAINLDIASNATPSGFNNIVVRGGTLRVTMTAAGDFCTGYVTILPGNRYSATTSTSAYYANNGTSGAQGSSAVQSI